VFRRAIVAVVMGAVVLGVASPAFAHVTVQPSEAEQGGYATVAFQVPNESDDASTVRLEVTFPEDHPITSVRTQPVPGWTVQVDKAPLENPIGGEGDEIGRGMIGRPEQGVGSSASLCPQTELPGETQRVATCGPVDNGRIHRIAEADQHLALHVVCPCAGGWSSCQPHPKEHDCCEQRADAMTHDPTCDTCRILSIHSAECGR